MKRLLLAPLLSLGLLAAVITPPVKANEVECYYSTTEEYEKCITQSTSIPKIKYPLKITKRNLGAARYLIKYRIWLTPPYIYRTEQNPLLGTYLNLISETGDELKIIKGHFGYAASRFHADSSLVIPSQKITSWKNYNIENSVHPVFQINYIDFDGNKKQIEFQRNGYFEEQRKGTFLLDILKEISKLEPGEIRYR